MRIIPVAAACLWIAGCGYSHGFIRDAATTQHIRYQFAPKTIRYVRTVRGEARTDSLLCCIPLDKTALYADAMDQLHENARLGDQEVLFNIREDYRYTWYLVFYCIRRVTISADVVALTPSSPAGSNTDSQQPERRSPSEPAPRPSERQIPEVPVTTNSDPSPPPAPAPPSPSPAAPQPSFRREKEPKKYVELLRQARLAHSSGVVVEAIRLAREAVAVYPSGHEAHKLLGLLYYSRNEYGNAAQHYKEYLRVRPNAPDAATIQAMIKHIEAKTR